MRGHGGKSSISGLAALVLLGVFAAGLLSVLLTGASGYRRLTQRDAASCDERTCAQYLATKVRQASAPDFVVLSEFGDGDSLLIREQIDGVEYQTEIYCYDGWLMELFTAAQSGLAPEDGEKILPVRGMELERSAALLCVTILGTDGSERTVRLSLRGSEEAAG